MSRMLGEAHVEVFHHMCWRREWRQLLLATERTPEQRTAATLGMDRARTCIASSLEITMQMMR